MNVEQFKNWQQSGREALSGHLAPATLNTVNRTVDVIWYTGVDIARVDWVTGRPYTLRFDPKGADLSFLNNGAPVLDDHMAYDGADGQKGVVDKAWVEGKNYKGTLRFSKRPAVDGIWQDVQDKIITKFSMGVELLNVVDKTGKDGRLEMRTARNWRPFEISISPLPGDFGTTTLSAPEGAPRLSIAQMFQFRMREIGILRLRA
ncbi:MAG: hypothetical protein ACR2JB_19110 [Bryobacteraceae bacterium]